MAVIKIILFEYMDYSREVGIGVFGYGAALALSPAALTVMYRRQIGEVSESAHNIPFDASIALFALTTAALALSLWFRTRNA